MRPVIHSQKHYVQQSRSTVATVALNTIDIILAVEGTIANAVDEVIEGAIIKAVYVEMWLIDAGAAGSFSITLEKRPSNLGAIAFATSQALGAYGNKNNILYTTQGLTPNDGLTGPMPVIRQWFKIPKGKQRFGLGDKLVLNIANMGANDLFHCGFFIYKELT